MADTEQEEGDDILVLSFGFPSSPERKQTMDEEKNNLDVSQEQVANVEFDAINQEVEELLLRNRVIKSHEHDVRRTCLKLTSSNKFKHNPPLQVKQLRFYIDICDNMWASAISDGTVNVLRIKNYHAAMRTLVTLIQVIMTQGVKPPSSPYKEQKSPATSRQRHARTPSSPNRRQIIEEEIIDDSLLKIEEHKRIMLQQLINMNALQTLMHDKLEDDEMSFNVSPSKQHYGNQKPMITAWLEYFQLETLLLEVLYRQNFDPKFNLERYFRKNYYRGQPR